VRSAGPEVPGVGTTAQARWRTASHSSGSAGDLVKIVARMVTHSNYVIFQFAEVAVPHKIFVANLEWIGQLRLAYASG